MQIRDEGKKLKEQQAKGGCPYVVAYHGYDDGTGDKYAEFCNKIASRTSAYCPKHELLVNDIPNEAKRRMAHARNGKERKAMMRQMLETSPLAAMNPAFPENKPTGYER